jgi:RNA polymerase sigma-70 factor (ECF subfamily)
LERIAQGDSSAVTECLDTYGGLIWSMARRQGLSQQDAEDAVQEIFIDVWKSAARYDEKQAAEVTFISMIARRRLIDRRRRTLRRPFTDSIDDEVLELAGDDQKRLEDRVEASLASRALDLLRPNERKVLLLSTFQGLSHGQIAESTGLPLGTVKTYIRRGLMRVKEILADPERLREAGESAAVN